MKTAMHRGVTVVDAGFTYSSDNTRESWMGNEHSDGIRVSAPDVDGFTFSVAPGTLTLLCGSSGCGKSTLLRLINGLAPGYYPGTRSGRINVEGRDISSGGIAASSEVTTTVFQNPRTQFFTTNVRTELAFHLENRAVEPSRILSYIDEALSALNITALADESLSSLSGGQLQRVACAQALAARTPVILLDEPTSNLSPAGVDSLTGALRVLKDRGAAIVVAEHRLSFLRGLVDEVIFIDSGREARRWTGEEFYSLSHAERRSLGLRELSMPLNANKRRVTSANDLNRPGRLSSHGPDLVCENLRFSYGARRVLEIDRLVIPAGHVTAITGENGVGKTTLARLIVGLAKPERPGVIRLGGRSMSPGLLRKAATMVMQDVERQLFTETLRRDVMLGVDESAVDAIELLSRFDLAHVADRHPLTVSGGQKQRAVIASAVAQGRQICVLDEPTSGVDYRHLVQIAQQMRVLASCGVIVIVITHDEELIAECADRVINLDDVNKAAVREESR